MATRGSECWSGGGGGGNDEKSEEEDYMSQAFLDSLVAHEKDVKKRAASTSNSRVIRRKRTARENDPNYLKSEKVRMQELREEGLKKEIDETNKGFQMLKKMGFVEGQGLGKDGKGRTEPIAVVIRQKKVGLGKDTEVRERIEKEMERRHSAVRVREQEFAQRVRSQADARRSAYDLRKARPILETLDLAKGYGRSPLWPPEEEENGENEIDNEAVEVELENVDALLGAVLETLRSRHVYCFYCGCSYDDEEDLAKNCAGDRDDH